MVTRDPSRRIVLAGAGTAAGLALLFAYPTSLNRSSAPAGTPASGTPSSGTPSSGTARAGSAARQPTSASGGSGSTVQHRQHRWIGHLHGRSGDTRWGPVQVEITVQGGKVVSARTVQVPANNSRDVEINDYAVPILNQEAVQAGSAEIDAVSGATVTSDGYIGSLQSALDQAHR